MEAEQKLIIDLDRLARKHNKLEYGLPIIDGIPKEYLDLVLEYKNSLSLSEVAPKQEQEENSFFCWDECVGNACEDDEVKRCEVECEKCKNNEWPIGENNPNRKTIL